VTSINPHPHHRHSNDPSAMANLGTAKFTYKFVCQEVFLRRKMRANYGINVFAGNCRLFHLKSNLNIIHNEYI